MPETTDPAGGQRDPGDAREGGEAAWPPDHGTLRAAAGDRSALAGLLVRAGLAEDTAFAVADTARPGWRLSEPTAGSPVPRSRLGGPGLLAPGDEWPRTRRGTPLELLAALDLAELPEPPAPTPLPAAGWLLLYVLVADETGLGRPGYAGRAGRPDSAHAALVPEDLEPMGARRPPRRTRGPRRAGEVDPPVPEAWPVVGHARLELPWGRDLRRRLGLTEPELAAVDAVALALREVEDVGATDAVGSTEREHRVWDLGEDPRRVRRAVHLGRAERSVARGTLDDARHGSRPLSEAPYDVDLVQELGPIEATLLGSAAAQAGWTPAPRGHAPHGDALALLACPGDPRLGLSEGVDLRASIRPDDARAGRWERCWVTGHGG